MEPAFPDHGDVAQVGFCARAILSMKRKRRYYWLLLVPLLGTGLVLFVPRLPSAQLVVVVPVPLPPGGVPRATLATPRGMDELPPAVPAPPPAFLPDVAQIPAASLAVHKPADAPAQHRTAPSTLPASQLGTVLANLPAAQGIAPTSEGSNPGTAGAAQHVLGNVRPRLAVTPTPAPRPGMASDQGVITGIRPASAVFTMRQPKSAPAPTPPGATVLRVVPIKDGEPKKLPSPILQVSAVQPRDAVASFSLAEMMGQLAGKPPSDPEPIIWAKPAPPPPPARLGPVGAMPLAPPALETMPLPPLPPLPPEKSKPDEARSLPPVLPEVSGSASVPLPPLPELPRAEGSVVNPSSPDLALPRP
jgi:hypothetical protein